VDREDTEPTARNRKPSGEEMNVMHTQAKHTLSETRASEHERPREAAIARVVALSHALAIRSSAATDGDIIAAAIDACATGGTVYTVTDGEGLLRMAPALFRASHLGLPIVIDRREHWR
jgi:hypothetical protein